MIVLGNPGTAKTGGLASLVKAGYKLGILDYDNGLDPLKHFILQDCPDKIDNVFFRTLRDKKKVTPSGMIVDGPAVAFPNGLKMLDNWKHEDIDLGSPAEWGPDWILVLDSLTHCGRSAYDWAEQIMPVTKSGLQDPRAIYFRAQDAVMSLLSNLTSEYFRTNVIVLTHVNYVTEEDGKLKGYPNAVGSAISPKIGSFFNSIALCSTKVGGKRVIQTAPTSMIDLKNPVATMTEYPISTGFADFFQALRKPPEVKTKPTLIRR